jgi:hypothetical protein
MLIFNILSIGQDLCWWEIGCRGMARLLSRRGDTGTQGHGDTGTQGHGDTGTRGHGDTEKIHSKISPRLPLSASPPLRVPPSPRLPLSASPPLPLSPCFLCPLPLFGQLQFNVISSDTDTTLISLAIITGLLM